MSDPQVKAALELLARAVGVSAPVGPTFAEVWRRYFREEGRGHDTARDIERRGRLLVAFMGDRKALEFTTELAEDYREVRLDDARSHDLYERAGVDRAKPAPRPATVNREIATARRALQWAVEHRPQLLPHNPLATVRMEEERNVRQIGHRSEDDLQRLLALADPEERAAILLYIDCGPRRMEVLSLQWTQILMARVEVDGEEKTRPIIHIWDTKNADPRRIGITWRAYDAIMARPRVSRYVFPGRRPGRYRTNEAPIRPGAHITPDGFNRRIQRLCRRAGIFRPDGHPLTIHDFRHWFIYQAEVVYGVPRRAAMKQTGHKTTSAYDRYGIGGEEETALVFEQVERRREQSDKRRK